MPDRFDISVPGRPRHLGAVRNFFGLLVQETPEVNLSMSEMTEIQLVLQEACINVIRHAHEGDHMDPVRVSFIVTPEELTIEVRDRGEGFDPDKIPEPDTDGLQEGGYGVFIMKQSMDTVETQRERDGFVLRMTKRFGVPTGASAGE